MTGQISFFHFLFLAIVKTVGDEKLISQIKLVLSTTKSKRPTTYAKIQKIHVNRQILLLLTSNWVEPNRQKLTVHTPNINVEMPKNSCASQLTKCKGGLRTVGK
jgi:hypothetical protein